MKSIPSGHGLPSRSFRKFIEDNKDEITALQVLYNQPYGQRQFTYQQIQELAERIKQPPNSWTPEGFGVPTLNWRKTRSAVSVSGGCLLIWLPWCATPSTLPLS